MYSVIIYHQNPAKEPIVYQTSDFLKAQDIFGLYNPCDLNPVVELWDDEGDLLLDCKAY